MKRKNKLIAPLIIVILVTGSAILGFNSSLSTEDLLKRTCRSNGGFANSKTTDEALTVVCKDGKSFEISRSVL